MDDHTGITSPLCGYQTRVASKGFIDHPVYNVVTAYEESAGHSPYELKLLYDNPAERPVYGKYFFAINMSKTLHDEFSEHPVYECMLLDEGDTGHPACVCMLLCAQPAAHPVY
jgi:hypothetical protein